MSGAVANAIETEERGDTPAAPLCKNGHQLTDENVKVVRYRGEDRTYRRCRECMRLATLKHKRSRREDPEFRAAESQRSMEYQARMREQETEEARQKRLSRQRAYDRRPDVRERKRLWMEAFRRANGVKPLAEHLAWLAERNRERRGTAPAGKVSDKVPMEIRMLWRRSSPGSSLRRMFPTPMHLNNASYDTLTRLLTAASDTREDEWKD